MPFPRPSLADHHPRVLDIVARIPPGRFTTYGSIARVLQMNPRHVARILATLDEDQSKHLPWHRVMGAEGRLSTNLPEGLHDLQKSRLEAEGIAINGRGYVDDPDRNFFPIRSI